MKRRREKDIACVSVRANKTEREKLRANIFLHWKSDKQRTNNNTEKKEPTKSNTINAFIVCLTQNTLMM